MALISIFDTEERPTMMTGLVSIRSPWLVIYCLTIAIHLWGGNLHVESFSLTQELSSTRLLCRRNNNNGVLGGGFPTAIGSSTIRRLESSSHNHNRSGGRSSQRREQFWCLPATSAGKGFGVTGGTRGGSASNNKNPKIRQTKVKRVGSGMTESSFANPERSKTSSTEVQPKNRPYVKAEQEVWLDQLADQTSRTQLGRVVAECNIDRDPFWDLMPALIASKFPTATETDLSRIAQFVQHALQPTSRPDDWVDLPYRPYDELHAYMPGLPVPTPFIDSSRLSFCRELEENYDVILREYWALHDHHDNGASLFQSVTSMNYQSGWQTLVLFYNGHRIPKFPYHLCPTTTRLLEQLPLAGRIAGFNRQLPQTGIPLHTDGNNLWLTCQMGMEVPAGETAYIEVAGERRLWQNGRCMVYDTTFAHQTWNGADDERIVLHVDFFNTLALTPIEIKILQYIYKLREDFMAAEGVAKVGAHVL
jgi:ornithine lipid ester-linked acyl 2-hydroxylase